ncbi:MAG TPA: hypothetical protein H9677_05765 [Firmicutes bacterium]|nr:hypothetical protein [Bacillota bacterium]
MEIEFKKPNTVISAECFPDKKRPALCITKGAEMRVYGYFQDKECADEFISTLYQLVVGAIKK